MENNFLVVSPAPHVKSRETTQSIMRDVLIALSPAMIAAIIFFGVRAILVVGSCVAACVLTEYILQKLTKRAITISDLSAVVTGVLLSFNLPSTIPIWIAVIGSIFSVAVVKFIFGGIGKNIVNPALAGRAFLLAAYPVAMTTWVLDGVATATPLAVLKLNEGSGTIPDFMNMLIGHRAGCLGETSIIALLIGFIYLLFKRIIKWHIPVVYIATVFVITLLIGRSSFSINALYEVFFGGLVLGAVFMATDYTTSPVTDKGKIIFAIGCGVITVVIRLAGGYTEGVSYSILLMNLVVPLIDLVTKNRVFGRRKKA